jgi:Flp pilus assembly protein TadD
MSSLRNDDGFGTMRDQGSVVLALAIAVTALAYAGTLRFGFVYDDLPQIVLNESLTTWQTLPSLFIGNSWKFLNPVGGNYYRPLFMAWLLVNRMFLGLNPVAWHAITLCVHLLATGLSFSVARQFLRDRTQAGLAALLFGLHPIHIESVAWISGVTDPLMAVFVFAAFWAWNRGEDTEGGRAWWRGLAAVLYLMGCLVKETALLLPVVLLAYRFWFEEERSRAWRLCRMWPLGLSAIAYVGLRASALRGVIHPTATSSVDVLLAVPFVLWQYLRRLVWPVGLSPFYNGITVASALQWQFWLPALALSCVSVAAWICSKRSRLLGLSLLWIVTFLLPAIIGLWVFQPGEWIHDRYLYLPSFGLCVIAAYALAQLPRKVRLLGQPTLPSTATLVLVFAMSITTAWQQQYWASSLLLFLHSVRVAPKNPWARGALAGELFNHGDREMALKMFAEATELDPNSWKNNADYAMALYKTGDYKRADDFFARAVAAMPEDPTLRFNQGLSRLHYGNYAGAAECLREALRLSPVIVQGHYWLGYSLEQQGMLDAARYEYNRQLQIDSRDDTDARSRLEALTGK